MVEVVTDGRQTVYKIQCRKCNSILNYRDEDTETLIIEDKNFLYEHKLFKTIVKVATYVRKTYAITCPICKQKNDVNKRMSDIFPQKIGERLATKEEIRTGKIID